MKAKFKRKYSGKKSRKFWDKINEEVNESRHDRNYSLGVALQNIEDAILKQIEVKQ